MKPTPDSIRTIVSEILAARGSSISLDEIISANCIEINASDDMDTVRSLISDKVDAYISNRWVCDNMPKQAGIPQLLPTECASFGTTFSKIVYDNGSVITLDYRGLEAALTLYPNMLTVLECIDRYGDDYLDVVTNDRTNTLATLTLLAHMLNSGIINRFGDTVHICTVVRGYLDTRIEALRLINRMKAGDENPEYIAMKVCKSVRTIYQKDRPIGPEYTDEVVEYLTSVDALDSYAGVLFESKDRKATVTDFEGYKSAIVVLCRDIGSVPADELSGPGGPHWLLLHMTSATVRDMTDALGSVSKLTAFVRALNMLPSVTLGLSNRDAEFLSVEYKYDYRSEVPPMTQCCNVFNKLVQTHN